MKKLSIIAGLALTAVGALTFYLKGSQDATLNRPIFAHLDKGNAKKAYNSLMRDILHQKINIDDMSDDQLDALLLERYDQMGFN